MTGFFIHIQNDSPMLLGTGEGFTASIDSDIVFDDYGFPVFPARRLKGLLRESAHHLSRQIKMAQIIVNFPPVERVFGDTTHEGAFQIYDGILEDRSTLIEHLEYLTKSYPSLFTPQSIMESFTSVRQQTALVKGVALDHSLRTSRVLKKGHCFVAPLFIDQARKEQVIPFLALAAKNLRYVGMNRNRGFGLVRCYLEEKGQEAIDWSREALQRIRGGVSYASN